MSVLDAQLRWMRIYIMFDVLGTDVVAQMSRALDLAYDIVIGNVEDEKRVLMDS